MLHAPLIVGAPACHLATEYVKSAQMTGIGQGMIARYEAPTYEIVERNGPGYGGETGW